MRRLAEHDADATAAASMAKSYACGAAVDVTGKAMQLHGGMGYTWESGIHVYLKRAALNRSLFGSPAAHRVLRLRPTPARCDIEPVPPACCNIAPPGSGPWASAPRG